MLLYDSSLEHFRFSCFLTLTWQRTNKDMIFVLRPNLFFMEGNLGPYGHTQVEYSNVIRILILRIFFRLRKERRIHNTDDPSVNFNRYIRYF